MLQLLLVPMDFKKFANDYFNFTLQERRGIWFLFICLFITVAIRMYFVFAAADTTKMSMEFLPMDNGRDSTESYKDKYQGYSPFSRLNKPDSFNPNFASYGDLLAVGFSSRLAKTIIKYRGMGGEFRKQTDLFKIHNFDSATYYLVKPWIKIPGDEGQLKLVKNEESMISSERGYIELTMVEINKCDTNDLKALKGIGSFLAKNIVDYRTRLGGYHKLSQLLEVWKLRPETFELIIQRMTLDTGLVLKINVNTATPAELAIHPYIGKRLAENLVNYRNMHGIYRSWKDFEKLYFYKKENFEKLRPYLRLE